MTICSSHAVFRRDPLGQVSMNVGLYPTVRCHFDSAENILRVIVVEQVMTDEKDLKEDVVIYALKVSQHGIHSCIEFLSTRTFTSPHTAWPRPES